jgi:type IV pilus assembly protein PilO
VNLDLYVQQLNEIDRSFGALLKQLPNKSEVEALLVEINQAGMGRGLQFELFKPGAEQVKDFYAELPINVRLTGSYHDFGCFRRGYRQAVQDRHLEQYRHCHQPAEQGWNVW